MDTFFDLVLKGFVEPEDINDYVDKWHKEETEETLPEYLGFTDEMYQKYLNGHMTVEQIIKQEVMQVVNENGWLPYEGGTWIQINKEGQKVVSLEDAYMSVKTNEVIKDIKESIKKPSVDRLFL